LVIVGKAGFDYKAGLAALYRLLLVVWHQLAIQSCLSQHCSDACVISCNGIKEAQLFNEWPDFVRNRAAL
jgi:hypothetical protein